MRHLKLIALLAVLALLPSAAEAQTTITACYVPKSGSVYRVKADGAPPACAKNHVEFSWETDTQPLYGYVNRYSDTVTIAPGAIVSAAAYCPADRMPISGGFTVLGIYGGPVDVQLLGSVRLDASNAWVVAARNDGTDPVDIRVDAHCIQYNP